MIFSLIYFAAALQGFLLSLTLWLHKRNVSANHILACWLVCLSIDLLGQIYYQQAYREYPQFIGLTNFLPLTYGSFLFLFVKSLFSRLPFCRRDLLHFLPFVLMLLLIGDYLLLSGQEKLQLVEDISAGKAGWRMDLVDWAMNLAGVGYAFITFWFFRRQVVASGLMWLRIMLTINCAIWAFVCLSCFVPELLPIKDNQFIYLLSSLFIYILGYFSLKTPEIFSPATEKESGPKYGDNRLSDDLREQLSSALVTYLQESEIWKDNQLSLNQLAEKSGFSAHHISQVLNDHLGKSFNDFLAEFRIQAVCAQLLSESDKSILDIAMECGFSSKSSFNASFKKITGTTPSAYRKSIVSD
jgi:AraC-like DNA-binding protein